MKDFVQAQRDMLQQELENQRTEYERKLHEQGMAMDRQLQQALEEMETIRKELVKQQSAKKDRAPAAAGDERLKEALADATTDLQVSFFFFLLFSCRHYRSAGLRLPLSEHVLA